MAKSYEQFRYSDWEWIVVHFPPEEREDIAKTAWLIAQCSADEIAKHKQLDPRIVIPLCAIEFQDEINWEKLKGLKEEIKLVNAVDSFIEIVEDDQPQNLKQVLSNNFINQISDSDRWKNLISCLDINLRCNLLYRLSDSYRCLYRNDWRYVFQKLRYEFKISWHYELVYLWTYLCLIFAIDAMIDVIFQKHNFWINGLIGLALYILMVFWGFPHEENPNDFIKFGLLGFLAFQSETYHLLKSNLLQQNIDFFSINLAKNKVTRDVASAVAVLRGRARGKAMAALDAAVALLEEASAAALVVARADAVDEASAAALARAGAAVESAAAATAMYQSETSAMYRVFSVMRTVGMAVGMAVAAARAGVLIELLTGLLVGALLSIGRLILYRQNDNKNYFRFLAIVTFPLFCPFPIMICFATIFLLRFFSWQHTLLIWLISFGTCIGLWLYGQDKERKARNPLRGILDIPN